MGAIFCGSFIILFILHVVVISLSNFAEDTKLEAVVDTPAVCAAIQRGQAGKLGREEPDEVQQSQMQGPAAGEEQPHASVQAWGPPAGEQVCGEGTWVSWWMTS